MVWLDSVQTAPRDGAGLASDGDSSPHAGRAREPGLSVQTRVRIDAIQRARLLEAMTCVAAERGLAETTVARVVARAGVSRRTFYDLFEDRDACFLAAFEQGLATLADRTDRAYARAGSWQARIRRALAALLATLDGDRALARLCLLEAAKASAPVLALRRATLETLADAVDEGRLQARAAQPPPLTAEATVGGALAVLHARLLAEENAPLSPLLNQLMSMIVYPYLGVAAARRELARSASPVSPNRSERGGESPSPPGEPAGEPFKDLSIRLTFRTVCVLATIGSLPGASNRDVAIASEVADQGQMSKLLRRLQRAGLIDNHGHGQSRGEANAWTLTPRGRGILRTVGPS